MASVDETLQLQAEREARIAARRRRIQDRIAAMRQGDNAGKEQSRETEELSGARKQIIESRRRLAAQRYKTDQDVTSAKVSADEREQQHRENTQQTKQALRAALLAEAEASARYNVEVASRWAALYDVEVPQELYEQTERQQQLCCRVIANKQDLIAEIRGELLRKDEAYVKLLKRQGDEVDGLLGYMAAQYSEMQAGYREELDAVERAFLMERTELLSSNRKEMGELLARRAKREADFMEGYLAAVERYQRQLEELRVADGEDFQVMKIKLESDMAALEQHLQDMLATFQLNQEKLEYNYRVLDERNHENQATISQQKRKVSRQRDLLVYLKERAAKQEAGAAENNAKTTEEYRRVTEQFKDLQIKCRHFQAADMRKFQAVWAMKQQEAQELAQQVMQADRIIHEQQLGWAWLAPDDSVYLSPHDEANRAAGSRAGSPFSTQRPGSTSGGASSEAGEEAGEEGKPAANPGEAEVEARLGDPRHWGALALLVDEAGFLLGGRAGNMIARLPQDERGLVQVRSILRALGITDGPAFDALMDALTAVEDEAGRKVTAEASKASLSPSSRQGSQGGAKPSQAAGDADSYSGSDEEEEEQQEEAGPALVAPQEAVRRLKAFMEGGSTGGPGRPLSSILGSPGTAVGATTTVHMTGAVRRAAEKEAQYWDKLAGVLSQGTYSAWCSLESRLQEYHGLLLARSQGLGEVEALAQQNAELQALLDQYMASDVNKTLAIPPTQLVG